MIRGIFILAVSVMGVHGASLALADEPSWIFANARYSHSRVTGNRVAQFAPLPAVQALPEVSDITSGYARTRINLRGADGTSDTYYRVRNFAAAGGGIDAQWERFHDAWQGSYLQGGATSFGPGYGGGHSGFGYGIPGGGPGYGPYGGHPGYGPGPWGGGGYGYGGGY